MVETRISHYVTPYPPESLRTIAYSKNKNLVAIMSLKCASWNIAAVNNNPFEYWITHPGEDPRPIENLRTIHYTLMFVLSRCPSLPAAAGIATASCHLH